MVYFVPSGRREVWSVSRAGWNPMAVCGEMVDDGWSGGLVWHSMAVNGNKMISYGTLW